MISFQQNTHNVVLDIIDNDVYYTELGCKGTAFSVNLTSVQIYHVRGTGKFMRRLSSINPSDSLLAKSHLSSSPTGCDNNTEVPDATNQFLMEFVDLPFSQTLSSPLEIQVR